MKKIYLSLLSILFLSYFSHAQWKTLYEGGAGTNNSLEVGEWGYRFYFSPAGTTNEAMSIFSPFGGTNNGARLFYYTNDFGSGTAGIYKRIPEMENYVALRIYIESDLPDSIGTMSYSLVDSTEFADNSTSGFAPTFETGHIGDTISFSNEEGKNMIYLYANLLRGDSISFRFHYIRIEADTTQFLQQPIAMENGFATYTSGQTLHIQTEDPNLSYSLLLYNSSGAKVYETNSQGSQNIPVPYETGIYYTNVSFADGSTKNFKVFIE